MNRFRELRIQHGYKTQQELASVLFVNQTAVSQWERGVTLPSSQQLLRLSQLYNVPTDYLLGSTSHGKGSASNAIRVPVLGTIPAGVPLEAIEDILDWEELPPEMGRGGKEYFGLQVKGDSMYPDFLDGDVVILQKLPCCESGDVCAVFVNGYEATLKKVKLDEDGSVTLKPRNPEYPPRTYTPQEVAELPVSIAGVVVELRRKMKK